MTKIGMLDTSISNHETLIEETKEVLEDQSSWIKTPALADKIHAETSTGFDEDYIRSLLTYVRQYMKNQNMIKVKREREGGHATYYWKVVDNE